MPGFSFSKAKNLGLLSQKEIERFAIMYLAMFDEVKPSNNVFMVAAEEGGNTVGSLRVILGNTMKKLRENQCFIDEGKGGTSVSVTPAAAPRKTGGKKRKADGDDAGSPASKKAASAVKKVGESEIVKKEDGGEESAEDTF